jgi:hypothetical protein
VKPSKFDHLTQEEILSLAYKSENFKEFLKTLGYGTSVSGSMKEKIKAQLLKKGVDLTILYETWNARMSDVDYVYRRYKTDANFTRNIFFDLTLEQFEAIVTAKCYYCGCEPGRVYHRAKDTMLNGVDRMNSKVGYTPENCVSCCTTCNIMKQKMSVEEFYQHAKSIYLNMKIGYGP